MPPTTRARQGIRLLGGLAVLLLSLALTAAPVRAANGAGDATQKRVTGERQVRLRAAVAAKRRHATTLMGLADVVATGAGLGADGEPEIRVFTARPTRNVPARLDGMRVRVEVSGRFYALRGATCESSGDGVCETLERWPLPVPIGVSAGHPSITAGTIGARVTDGAQVYALSNNHVFAAVDTAGLDDPILQPGSLDGGTVDDAIGTLFDFEPIAFCPIPLFCPQTNQMDAAIALTSVAELRAETPLGEHGSVPGYGAPSAQIHPAYGDPAVIGDEDLSQLDQLAVQKYGRTTGHTTGFVETLNMTTDVCYDLTCSLVARFEDQIGIADGSFSAGGDSGSLIVTDDAIRHPVALLFAGSETQTVANRIDLVLDRFGVTIDAGAGGLATDAAVTAIQAPGSAVVGETQVVTVSLQNRGSDPLPAFDVVFSDETEATSTTLSAPALATGASADVDFSWTPTTEGLHTLSAQAQLPGDENAANDTDSTSVTVFLTAPIGPLLQLWQGSVSTSAWTTVSLPLDYGDEMVVVCTPQYDLSAYGPAIARVRDAAGSSFQVGLGRPWFLAFPGEHYSATVHCMVVREGVYDPATDGVSMEAVRIESFGQSDGAGSFVGQQRSYARAYTQPVVLGQVISSGGAIPGDTSVWSVFWSRGATAASPPSATDLYVGRHTGEDPAGRAPETLAYIVLEAGSGYMDLAAYRAGVGPDSVAGMEDAPPYTYDLSGLATATSAIATQAGMDGIEGSWPVLYGPGAVGPDALALASEEDWYFDPERQHPTEQVAYLVFGTNEATRGRCGLGAELAMLVPLLAWARRRLVGGNPISRLARASRRPSQSA